jgi:hypothetical protein
MRFTLSVLCRGAEAPTTVRTVGVFDCIEDAIVEAKQVVDATLGRIYVAGMTPAELVDRYREAGETPLMSREDEQTVNASSFNHFQYARARSEEICGGA